MRRAAIVVLDGVGCGEAPDAATYGDAGSNTLANVARAVRGMTLPNLEAAGLGNIVPIQGVAPSAAPLGAWGLMVPQSTGKDSTTGHWEIAGVHLSKAFPTYPQGFPPAIVADFAHRTGRKVIGNVAGSGTTVLNRFASEHVRTGAWIVYTSADSVFQIAAHEQYVPLDELYRACEAARSMLVAPHDVSRVIARPFVGENGTFLRTQNRRDFSIEPPSQTLLDVLQRRGIPRAGVGKVDDLFAGRAITATHTMGNTEGVEAIAAWLRAATSGLLFANLVDFDQEFGHRNDVPGFYGALRQFDAALPGLLALLREDDLLFLTADHGTDPTTPSTDHTRECVPLLALGHPVAPKSLGHRGTFSDLGATVGEWLGVPICGRGTSFLAELVAG